MIYGYYKNVNDAVIDKLNFDGSLADVPVRDKLTFVQVADEAELAARAQCLDQVIQDFGGYGRHDHILRSETLPRLRVCSALPSSSESTVSRSCINRPL